MHIQSFENRTDEMQGYRFRGSLVDSMKSIPWPRKGTWRIRQKYNPLLVFIPTPLLNSFCCIFQPLFIKNPCLFRAEEQSLYERSVIPGFIFNNYISFINPSLQLTLCHDGVYICKIKKNMVSCHSVADKLLVEQLPREF